MPKVILQNAVHALKEVETSPAKEIEVYFVPRPDGSIDVKAGDGASWYLLNLSREGVMMYGSVPGHLGFELDNRGRLNVTHE